MTTDSIKISYTSKIVKDTFRIVLYVTTFHAVLRCSSFSFKAVICLTCTYFVAEVYNVACYIIVVTSLIRTLRSVPSVYVLERCPYKRGHYDDVTFMTFHYSTYSFKCSVAKTRLTLVFKLHLNFLIYSTKALSFSSMQHCTSQLQSKYRLDKSLL